jgi:hypothetical protein
MFCCSSWVVAQHLQADRHLLQVLLALLRGHRDRVEGARVLLLAILRGVLRPGLRRAHHHRDRHCKRQATERQAGGTVLRLLRVLCMSCSPGWWLRMTVVRLIRLWNARRRCRVMLQPGRARSSAARATARNAATGPRRRGRSAGAPVPNWRCAPGGRSRRSAGSVRRRQAAIVEQRAHLGFGVGHHVLVDHAMHAPGMTASKCAISAT